MIKQWVCDASPLILLERIGHLNLLTELCEELVIPKGVRDEISSYKQEQFIWNNFFGSEKVDILKDYIEIIPAVAGWDLGKGESEVLSYALAHKGHEVIIDDLEARKCANTFNIPLRGTVGIILLGRKKNIISKAGPLIESLINAGLRFDIKWITKALELVGEKIDIKY